MYKNIYVMHLFVYICIIIQLHSNPYNTWKVKNYKSK